MSTKNDGRPEQAPVEAQAENSREAIEQRAAQTVDNLVRLGRESRLEQSEAGEAWLARETARLPGPARDRISQRNQQMAEMGVSEEHRAQLLKGDIASIEQTYVDPRFDFGEKGRMLKEQFGKETARQWIDQIITGPEFQMSDLDKVARLSFDANGLKSVNDLAASHEKGDEYLKRIAEVIKSADGPAAELLVKAGTVEFVPLTGGGDEFSILVRGEQPLDPELLGQAIATIESLVAEIDVSDLVDLNDPDTKLRFLGVSREEYEALDQAGRDQLEESFRQDVPEGFRMKASISGGVETMSQGLLRAITDPRDTKRLTGNEDNYGRALAKMMGGLWDASDKTAMEAKERFKKGLTAAEASPEERALSQLLSRNRAEREAQKRAAAQEAKVRQAEGLLKQMSDLQNLREQLGDKAFADAVQELMAKFNPDNGK